MPLSSAFRADYSRDDEGDDGAAHDLEMQRQQMAADPTDIYNGTMANGFAIGGMAYGGEGGGSGMGQPRLTHSTPPGGEVALEHMVQSLVPNANGKYVCCMCQGQYKSRAGLGTHRLNCERMMQWRCDWCGCRYSQTRHRAPGPNGSATLCDSCGRY
jgi:hypothetical protein